MEASSQEGAAEPSAEPSAVVVEGGEDAPDPPRRRRGPQKGPPPSLTNGIPAFEDPSRPLVRRFLATFVDAAFRPRAFFTHLAREEARGITWFAYVCFLAAFVWQAINGILTFPILGWTRGFLETQRDGLKTDGLEELARTNPDAAETWGQVEFLTKTIADIDHQILVAPTLFWVGLATAPLLAFFAVHLTSGLLHFTMRLLHIGGEVAPYAQTYRFVVYATAPLALGVLPGAALVSKVWFLVVLVIAMQRLHRVSTLGIIAGILLPLLLLVQVANGTVALGADAIVNARKPAEAAPTTTADVAAPAAPDGPVAKPPDAPVVKPPAGSTP